MAYVAATGITGGTEETEELDIYSIPSPTIDFADGGVIENTETTAYKVAMTLCEENGFEKPSIVFNYQESGLFPHKNLVAHCRSSSAGASAPKDGAE